MLPGRRLWRCGGLVHKSVRLSASFTTSCLHQKLTNRSINYDPTNPLLYTNRTLTLLRLHLYPRVIDDALTSIKLLPENMKAYYHLAQAQIALHQTAEALESSKQAHRYCVEEIYRGGKGGSSIGPITELVLKCKKEWWEEKEEARLKVMPGLLNELIGGLEQKKKWAIKEAIERNSAPDGIMLEEEVKAVIERQYAAKVEELRHTFDLAGTSGAEGKRRKVPDWCVDDISFAVMLDPVVVNVLCVIVEWACADLAK